MDGKQQNSHGNAAVGEPDALLAVSVSALSSNVFTITLCWVFPSIGDILGILLLADPHLLVIRLWFFFLHICIVFFKSVIIHIWETK